MERYLPKISIITPTLNSEKDIESCLLSVANQKYTNIEHLIIDGQSTDKTIAIVKKYAQAYPHIRWTSEKDEGIYDAMNKGIDISTGDWLYFLGSDDVLFDKKVLDNVFSKSDDCEKFDYLYGNVMWGNTENIYDGKYQSLKLMNKNICHQSIFTKKDLYIKYGKFDTRYKALADWVFNLRMFGQDDVRKKYLDMVIARYGLGGFSFLNKDNFFIQEFSNLVKDNFPEEYSYIEKIKMKELEIKNRNSEFDDLKEVLKKIESELNLLKKSKYWILRAWVEKLKFCILHPDKFLKKYLKKFKKLYKEAIFSYKKEGLIVAIRRSLNYLRYGKGALGNLDRKEESYEKWMKNIEKKAKEELIENIQNEIKNLEYKPKISIILPVYNSDEIFLRKAIFSVIYQYYENWELCIVNDCSTKKIIQNILSEFKDRDKRIRVVKLEKNSGISIATNVGVKNAAGEFIAFLDHDDEIEKHALFEVVKKLNENKQLDLIYSDDDKIDENGYRYDPQFKPDWSPELLLSYCYVSHLKIVRRKLFIDLGGFKKEFDGAQDYDFLLRLAEKTNKIGHIAEILYHWRSLPGSVAASTDEKPLSVERGRLAVQQAIDRRGIKGQAIIPDFAEKSKVGIYKINYSIDAYQERVTIIIPTKDRIDLLKRCIDSIKEKTSYLNYEILVINNNSVEKATTEYLEKERIKFITINNGVFNFSHINNEAVKDAKSDLIVFLNNDTEIVVDDWLLELVGQISANSEIGAVGAKLLYSDGKIQHAGVILGLNEMTAGHANKLLGGDDAGYLHYAKVTRNFSAVTAACLITRKKIFMQVGGFDEENLAVSYNDVDYGLKLLEAGYRVVFNPDVLLYHHEGKTRGFGDSITELNYFKNRWKKYIKNDPYYNKNLSLKDEQFSIKYE